MRYRTFGRTGWQVSEVGYGMWGMVGWSGADDERSRQALQLAADLGCTFFDTAWAYGNGHSEQLLGELVRANPAKKLIVATNIPPRNGRWPSRRDDALADVFPRAHIRRFAEKSLANLGLPAIDLLQFHVWEDAWADDQSWQEEMAALKREGLIRAVGISLNRWEPWNGLKTLRTGRIDSVQVIYNIFDQAPEDELLPLCRELNIGVIARVPFDEGTLTGKLTKDSRWPEGDWRNTYFVPDNLISSVDRAEALRPLVPADSTMADMALRFILANPDIATVIPGMRTTSHVQANMAAGDADPLPAQVLKDLRGHRWDRQPKKWSQ